MAIVGSGTAGAALTAAGLRLDPLGSYNFNVEIEGVLVAGFTQASGLEVTTNVFRYSEGGRNVGDLTFAGKSTYSDIVLTHGVTVSNSLYSWYMDVVNGKIQRKNATIYMLSQQMLPVKWWNLYRALPVKWKGPTFDASHSAIAFEVLTLVHEGIS
jgi:phage tail-like protein